MDKKREDLCRYRLEKARICLSSAKLLVQSEDIVVQQIDHIIPFFIVSGAYELGRRIWLRKAGYIIKESTLAVRMDSDLKKQVEPLYEQMGTSFA